MSDILGSIKIGASNDVTFEGKTAKKDDVKAETDEHVKDNTDLNQSPNAIIGKSLVKSRTKEDEETRKILLAELAKREEADSFMRVNTNEIKTNGQLKGLIDLMDLGFKGFLIEEDIKKSTPEEAQRAVERAKDLIQKQGVQKFHISPEVLFAKQERWGDIQRLIDEGGSMALDGVYPLSQLDNEQYKEAVDLVFNYDVSPRNASSLCNTEGLGDGALHDRTDKFHQLHEDGFSPENACTLASLYNSRDTSLFDTAMQFVGENMDAEDAVNLAELDDEMRSRSYNLFKKHGFCVSDAITLSKYFNSNKEAQEAVKSCGCEKPQAMELISNYYQNNPELFKVAAKFKSQGCTMEDIGNFTLKASMYGEYDPEKTVECAKRMLKRFENLMKQEGRLDIIDAAILAKFDGEEFDAAMEYFETVGETYKVDEHINNMFHGTEEEKESALKTLEGCRKRNEKVENLFREMGMDPKTISPKDRCHIGDHCFKSEFYTPKQYVEKFFEYKNMEAQGFKIFNTEQIKHKAKEDYAELKRCFGDRALYANIDDAMKIDPNSREGQYFADFLSLMQEGVINPSGIRDVITNTTERDGKTVITSQTSVSENLKKDIDLYKNVKAQFPKGGKAFKKALQEAFVPTVSNEAAAKMPTGAAFQLEGEDFIRMKKPDGTQVPIRLSKETYMELFPPVSRFSTSQQVLGDCYCIETLMTMFCNDNTRADLLSMMSEDKDGNIALKFPNANTATIYKDGKLPENEDSELYSSGADGYKLFENAFGNALEDDMIQKALKSLKSEEKRAEFADFVKEHRNSDEGIYIYNSDGNYHWTTFEDAVKRGLYAAKDSPDFSHYSRFNQYLLANGSQESFVYEKTGCGDKAYYSSSVKGKGTEAEIKMSKKDWRHKYPDMPVGEPKSFEELFEDMKQDDFFDKNNVHLGMEHHAWGMTKEKDEDGKPFYCIYNPHNQGLPIKFNSLEELKNHLTENGAYTVLCVKNQ